MPLNNYYQTLTVMGAVIARDDDALTFSVQARSGDVFQAVVGPSTYYTVMSNLDDLNRDRVPNPDGLEWSDNPPKYDLVKYIQLQRPVTVTGLYYEHGGKQRFEARAVYLMHSDPKRYLFEETHWWLVQISLMADRWLDIFFDARRAYTIDDFSEFYSTNLNITGQTTNDNVQECATLSRLIYGLSSAYLLTGADRYYLAAKAAVAYQREAFRSLSHDGEHCFWASSRRRSTGEQRGEKLIVPSHNPDDEDTIPLYEQIYALAGLAQYYRITCEWEVLEDIRRTVNTFQDYYWDYPEAKQEKGFAGTGGYYSHLDYATMRPDTAGLDRSNNRSRKNWNSVGDHIPAYLINLILAIDPLPLGTSRRSLKEFLAVCQGILDETSEIIGSKFEDPQSDYVNERFMANWDADQHWGWQQNRAVVGHNLKIAWNLTRVAFYCQARAAEAGVPAAQAKQLRDQADNFLAFARRLADRMGEVGLDKIRGGIFDAVERQPTNGMPTEFAWGSTKDFWQQEQGILAYLILHGATPNDRKYLDLARECTAFWNLFFIDRDRQGIFFRTSENGLPIIQGAYGQKGGHSVSGYHAFELNYLAHLYMRAFVDTGGSGDNNFCLYFKVAPNTDQQSVNTLPDFFAPGAVRIQGVRVNGIDQTENPKVWSGTGYQIHLDDLQDKRAADGTIEITVDFARV
jgi:hypothetical protein